MVRLINQASGIIFLFSIKTHPANWINISSEYDVFTSMLSGFETTLCKQTQVVIILIGTSFYGELAHSVVTQQRTYRERKGKTDTRRSQHNNHNQCSHFDTDRYSY